MELGGFARGKLEGCTIELLMKSSTNKKMEESIMKSAAIYFNRQYMHYALQFFTNNDK